MLVPTDLRGHKWTATAGEKSEVWTCSHVTWTGSRWSVIVRREDGAYLERTLKDTSAEGIEQFVVDTQKALDAMLAMQEEELDFSDLIGEEI